MLALAVAVLLLQAPQCLEKNGKRVCGATWVESERDVACAQTAGGVCGRTSRAVRCFDPPRWASSEQPAARCLVAGERVECGYDCQGAGAVVACAKTPRGKCVARDGAVTCFDPPPIFYALDDASLPDPTCVARDGGVTCGFGCVVGDGGVACAQTPLGVCSQTGDACFDPSVSLSCAHGRGLPRAECVQPKGGRAACGYHCAIVGRKAACAQTPEGRCRGLVCTDPPVRRIHAACIERVAAQRPEDD